jgi:hypothetical protein
MPLDHSAGNSSSLVRIAFSTTARSSSSIVVLVKVTAFFKMIRQTSTSFSPSSSFSGTLDTASVIIFDANGSKNENIITLLGVHLYLYQSDSPGRALYGLGLGALLRARLPLILSTGVTP